MENKVEENILYIFTLWWYKTIEKLVCKNTHEATQGKKLIKNKKEIKN